MGEESDTGWGHQVETFDGLCGVRMRGSGRTGLSDRLCQTTRARTKSGFPSTGVDHGYMSAQPPPPPYGTVPPPGFAPPPFPPPRPRRRRPSKWWFVVGTVLVVGAVAVGVSLFAWTLTNFITVDATVRADAQPHQITLEDDRERMLWGREALSPDCLIVDDQSGEEVVFSPISGSFTKSDSSGDWVGISRFDPGSVHLTVTCTAAGGDAQIGRALQIGSFVGGIFATILIPLILGGLGILVLIITTVFFALGRPRDEPAP